MDKNNNFNYNLCVNIPNSYFIVIDIIIVAIFVVCFIVSYKNGVLYELISFFMLIISGLLGYFLSPILAKRFYLFKPEIQDNPILNSQIINYGINVIVWFAVLTIFFVLLFTLIKPLFKKISKIPVVGWVNKVFGLVFGLIKGFIFCSLLTCILSTTFFQNYNDIKNETLIKYVDLFSSKAISFVINSIDYNELNNDLNDIDIKNSQHQFEKWLIDQGFINE